MDRTSPIFTRLIIDAKSVFESVRVQTFKPPSENVIAGHCFWLRELCERKLIQHFTWADTRDMLADALTKGTVERNSIEHAMNGKFCVNHSVEQCSRVKPRNIEHAHLTCSMLRGFTLEHCSTLWFNVLE